MRPKIKIFLWKKNINEAKVRTISSAVKQTTMYVSNEVSLFKVNENLANDLCKMTTSVVMSIRIGAS